MGALSAVPLLPVLGVAKTAGDIVLARARQNQATRQAREQATVAQEQARERAALAQAQQVASSAEAEQQRRAALRRAVARQRASFGARGIGSGDTGSAEAILLGLFTESDGERAVREQSDALRQRAQEMDLSQKQQLNLLQVSQLAARERLGFLENLV